MINHLSWLILGISYGVLNIFTYQSGDSNLLGTFLSSIPMWLVLPYFAAAKSNSRKKAVINSTLSLTGIFIGYHVMRMLKSGTHSLDMYDILWIGTGVVFGLLWGVIVYPSDNKNIRLLQKNLLPAAFIAEAMYEMQQHFVFRFLYNFNMLHGLLLVAGTALFVIINRTDLKSLKNYAVFITLLIIEFIGITIVYNLLYMIL